MKKIFFSLLFSALIVFSSCLKENHSVRFKNNYSQTVDNVVAGTAKIGTVPSNRISDYYAIDAGNFSISGITSGGQVLQGSGSVTGRGRHKWTISLSTSGQLSILKDL